jgi:chemotaxis protein methyltransferase CheR
MAIMLDEVNLLRKARIYATDINTDVLEQAQEGSFSPALFSHYTRNYRQAGGRGQLTDYCAPVNGRIVMKDQLRRRISFHQHNLAADASFNEFHLILCRNVMIYFDPLLQERATRLFHESLVNLGYFAIGNKESLRFNRMRTSFVTIDGSHKIFRKVRFQKL